MTAKPESTKVEQIERELDASRKLVTRRPLVFAMLLLGAIILGGSYYLVIPHLQKEIKDLQDERQSLNTKLSQRSDEVHELQLELAPFRVYAIGKYGGDERKALAQLSQELNVLRGQLLTDKQTVHEFHIRASLQFKGNWKADFHGEGTQIVGDTVQLNILSRSNTNAQPIKLLGQGFATTPDTNGMCRCEYDAMLSKGVFPSGRSLDSLTEYDVFEISYPGISHDKVVAEPISFVGAQLHVFVNDKYAITVTYTGSVSLDLSAPARNPLRVVNPDVFRKLLAEAIKGL
jgi:hypothetical protein